MPPHAKDGPREVTKRVRMSPEEDAKASRLMDHLGTKNFSLAFRKAIDHMLHAFESSASRKDG